MEEEELAAMRAHQEHFEQLRNAELVATQKMEQAERRKADEKERRLQQARRYHALKCWCIQNKTLKLLAVQRCSTTRVGHSAE